MKVLLTQTTSISAISKEKTLRYDVDYIKYHQSHTDNYYTFSDLFSLVSPTVVNEEILYDNFKYCEIGNAEKNGDIVPINLNFENRSLEDENYYTKIEKGDITSVTKNDILIAKVRPNLKKYVRITDDIENVFFTTAFIRLRAKEMPEILYYCLRSVFYNDLMAIARQGKGYPTINEKDIATLRFEKNIIDKLRKNSAKIQSFILDIEKKIADAKSKIKTSQEIIDYTFQHEFGFDYEEFENLNSKRNYISEQAAFSNNPDLRFSAKYHRPAGMFVANQLTSLFDKKIKHFLAEPIVLGASISPNDFDEAGRAYYVSMATIKTLALVLDETQLVSDSYFEKKKAKSIKKNDIIMARSGVAIGKTAIVNENFDGIFADFTMRIHFDETKYYPQFAYYYLRSKYFQYLIEIYKKGLQNQNIFPIVLQEFPIPDISLKEQNRIAHNIYLEIEKQEQIKSEIEDLRLQIYEFIESIISK